MASRSTLQSIFNHVVLPPDLPGGADAQGELVEKELIRRLLEAAIFLKNNSGDDLFPTWQVIENTLKSSSLANEGGMCNKSAIVKALKRLSPENCIILRIREQNAGLLIRTSRDDDASKVIIESFEISPTAESTLSAQGALQWGFPGAVTSVPFDVFNSSGFRGSLATFLEKASTEYLDQFAVKVRKAGAEVSEERNTVHPAIITQFLMTLLEVNGERLYLPVLRKRIRDDVCWDKAKLPWRRSPFWLVLRVCVQRLLYLHLGDEIGRIQYKALICLFLATLLSDCVTNLSSDRSELLRVKLCRRLAKLETEKKSLRGPKSTTHQHTEVLKVVEDSCTKSIDAAATALENEWKNWKKNFQRRVPKLPSHASPSDLRLTLPNSNEYFREILEPRRQRHPLARDIDPRLLSGIASKNTSKQFAALSKTYSSLAIREAAIESNPAEVPRAQEEIESNCIDLASSITNYMSAVGDAYDNDPEQMSLFILNIFDLWVAMDKCATAAYSLLNDYHPWFTPEILDVLLLIRWKQLKRLQAIQLHLHSRCEQAKRDKMTIFAGPSPGCFAERYVSSPDGTILAKSQARIEDSSSMLRESKSSELTDLNETFNDLTGKLRAVPCTQLRNLDGSHDIRGCKHCFYVRSRRRLDIKVHEDSLPMESHHDVQRRSIVFELNPPKAFAAYREATWSIVNRLCPKIGHSTIAKPEVLLSEYSQLRKYNHNQRDACFSLASSTKSFLGTHYNWKRLPASAHNVILPHGLKWSYYDSKRKVWSGEYLEKLSFAHHFVLCIPKELPFSELYSSPAFAADSPGPSSYEVIASTSDCSSNLTVHEFSAHQNLMGGRNRRWLSILAELGSSNINLSLQETTILFHHLALQAGPRLENDSMRAVHATFRDLGFCNRLAEQIGRHLDAIATNWRETNYMETLLTLSIRLFSLGHLDSRPESKKLILRIRNVTTEWIKLLRNEARNAQDVSLSETTARYCFLSAILCRRTFSPFITSRSGFDSESLKCFFEASLAMQESLVVDLSKFTRITRNMLVRDIKMAVLLTSLIREGAVKYPGSIGQAIDAVWPEGDNTQRHYADWALLPSPYNDWATSTTHGSEDTRSQVLFFHLLEGHLVIDGQTIGKLPADIRDSDILKELFGNQRLFALPSNLLGMDYALSNRAEDHHVHLGYRNNRLIIQARVSGSTLELVPRGVFGTGQSFDLPISLITDCFHWIDLKTRILEVRQKPRIWKRRSGNWTIDLRSRTAQRRESKLIDPFSDLAQTISRIFLHFEHPCGLTVFQPLKGKLSVEMKRLDLDFFVTNAGLLQCRQLCAVVDRDQDAGTFYGLQSMLVLRDVDDKSQRSIITPVGQIVYRRHRGHVLVQVEGAGSYAKYTINDLLRRLECPAEPRLLYAKAQLHAFTSYLLPDPLTGRTGTEEALACLESGYCQPWMPLSPDLVAILMQISNLTPQREYYPKDKQCQQTVHWDPQLTTHIQHDNFRIVVNEILKKSDRLSQFTTTQSTQLLPKMDGSILSLYERARWRRSRYEGRNTSRQEIAQPKDSPYLSRDGWCVSKSTSNVREVVMLLRDQPSTIHTTRELLNMLECWQTLGGYASTFDLYDIEEHLSANISEQWGGLVNLCREAKEEDAYNLMFQLGLIAFRENAHMTIIRVIVSFFLLQELKNLSLPRHQSFVGFRKNERPTIDALLPIIRMSYQPPKPMGPKKKRKGKNSHENIRPGDYLEFEKEGLELAEMLVKQWPCAQPSIEGFEATSLNLIEVCSAVLPEWQRIYWNLEFHHHINEVQAILNSHYRASNDVPVPLAPPNPAHRDTMGSHRRGHFSCPRLREDLLGKPAQYPAKPNAPIVNNAGLWQPSEPLPPNNPPAEHHSPPEILELERIVQEFGQSVCSVRSSYAEDLSQSITALKTLTKTLGVHDGHECTNIKDRGTLDEEITIAQTEIKDCFRLIVNSLSAHDARYIWLRKGNLWPRLTPVTILQQLRSSSPQKFGPGMRKLFISYARAIIRVQKLFRMREASKKHDENKLSQERTDRGHLNWIPEDFPDWLLLEIDANIQIRQDQVTVALEMIFPNSGSNSVLQMNMGQGKTSVIMPMVAAVLANGEMLNRLLIPKALLSQAAQILQARLGGLLGREIIHIPFSRRTHTSISLIEEYREIHENALRESGIILGVPEHMLSYKLSGLQRLADSKMREAEYMIRCQKWLDEVCRDVLDECDFTLAVKTQLIYPGGAQLAVDGHPNRWEVAMTVLGLVAHHLKDLARDYPQSIDILERNSTGFPVTHILRKDVEEALTSRIVDDICKRRTSILPLAECTDRAREAIRLFISQEKVDKSVVKRIASLFPDSPKARKNVYLLRGLLVHGILILCLKKRWNVQYGLHHGRDPMAVPFHAKGVPSDQAEWGHPDVAIIFTCLAFYYEGLSQQQLKRSLEAVLKSDHPATEYDRWTQSSGTLPEPLRHWNAITVDDEVLVGEIWRHLRFTTVAINHFLSHFVFPLHAKQFATKLQASGWDVPLYSSSSSSYHAPITESFMRPGVTTGFSGTNDNRRLLPLNIEQRDLPGLSHTNAEVLTYLLQPRNRKYRLAADAKGRRLSEIELLKRLQLGSIRILIDAGAFIMEMDNFTVARTWLTEDWSAKGAVYFNEDNKPWVVYRNGKRVPLFASPFADDMRDCVVYLDEAHTRGTDLKLPPNAEGALTLGLRQTKDHTVQAAMRLRQLGTTQSVTFIAPPEVHQSILDVCKKTSNDAVDSSGVITWLLDQTCETNRELQPLYFAQGKDFCQRTQAAATFQGFLSNPAHRESYLDILQQPEQQTLEQLYEPRYREANPSPTEANGVVPWERVAILTKTLAQQRQESQVHESTLSSALEEVEQEREVAFEVEEEREIQRPRRPKALKFPGLHQSILAFAQRGLLAFKNIAKASDMLENTQLGTKYAIKGRSLVPHLYLSVEFTRTIKLKKLGETDDTYTRPVNWILFNTATETALVIIPEEAESLIPIMREKPAPNTHLIMYAAPWTKVMLHFNSLDYYALPSLPTGWRPPSWLPFELGILGGRLYFTFAEYEDLLSRLHSRSEDRDEGDEYSGPSAVAKSHLGFLREWLAIRRQGQNITDTPMGYVCHDLQLRSDHPFFTTRVVKAPGPNGSRLESLRFNAAAEEEYYTSDDGMDMATRDSESDKTSDNEGEEEEEEVDTE